MSVGRVKVGPLSTWVRTTCDPLLIRLSKSPCSTLNWTDCLLTELGLLLFLNVSSRVNLSPWLPYLIAWSTISSAALSHTPIERSDLLASISTNMLSSVYTCESDVWYRVNFRHKLQLFQLLTFTTAFVRMLIYHLQNFFWVLNCPKDQFIEIYRNINNSSAESTECILISVTKRATDRFFEGVDDGEVRTCLVKDSQISHCFFPNFVYFTPQIVVYQELKLLRAVQKIRQFLLHCYKRRFYNRNHVQKVMKKDGIE